MADLTTSVIGGVDTHKDLHVAAALDSVGRLLGTKAFPTSAAGYRALLRWLRGHGQVVAVSVEGTGSWGAGFARRQAVEGVRVVEVNRPNRQHRRLRGKSDPVDADAEAAARAVLAEQATATPKAADGIVEAIRLLRLARRTAIKARTQAANQIHGVIDTAPEALRAELVGLSEPARIGRCSRLRPGDVATPTGAAKLALASLADDGSPWTRRSTSSTASSKDSSRRPPRSSWPSRALLGVAGDNPEWLGSEAAFAALCGASPIDASSGRNQRHRLNRGGERQANRALYVVVLNRLTWDPRSKAYMQRRLAEGETKKEVIRCLKRYVARELYGVIRREVNASPATAAFSDEISDKVA